MAVLATGKFSGKDKVLRRIFEHKREELRDRLKKVA
jgi:hypothetical protein